MDRLAKASGSRGGSSKVRLIVLEAEVSDGDLTQFTQAIQNALQPRQPPPKIIQVSATKSLPGSEELDDEYDEGAVEDAASSDQQKSRTLRPSKARSIKPPKVIDGVDWDSEPSLKSFVENFDIKTDTERYLAISLWFKDHRSQEAISTSHIYTGFRQLKWSTAIPDFTKPFRNMLQNQLYTGGLKDGFAINQLGEAKIKGKQRVPT